MYILLVVILIVVLLGGLPAFGVVGGAGYWPSGIAGVVLLVLLILLLTGRL